MRLTIPLSAIALLAIPTLALAQTADQPDAATPAPAGPAASSDNAGTRLAPGLPVKDKTGATIGSVEDVNTDSQGNQIASIRMGADQFAVDASALAVDNGAAVINATRDEIEAKLSNTR
jgi:hypothetical protein